MHALRTVIVSLLISAMALAAGAQTAGSIREVPVRIASATVQKFDPAVRSRNGAYKEALVLRLTITGAESDALPDAAAPFLYIGTHEMPVMGMDTERDGTIVLTFHDPNWQKLQGGEAMVLTTRHGDPINNPKAYDGYPRFDPKIIH
jgi:hypothetical protein